MEISWKETLEMGTLIQRGSGQALPPRWFEHPVDFGNPLAWRCWRRDRGKVGEKQQAGMIAFIRNVLKEQREQAGIKDCSESVALHSLFCDRPGPRAALGRTCCSFQKHQDIPWSRKCPGTDVQLQASPSSPQSHGLG